MGNEASLEGGEGPPSGLPEGLAPDGKGGFVRVPEGTPVDLGELSEEQRRQLAAAMSRAQGRQPGGAAAARRTSVSDTNQRTQLVGATRGPPGLSKSRTVDAFNQGPPGKPSPGRSPSSLSLFESRFRQEPKDPETKSSGMFGSSFLSGANPLSAVSSMTSSVSSSISSMGDTVNIPKFGLFGDEEEGDSSTSSESKQGIKPPGKGPQQGPGPKGPQQGGPPKPGQGPPGQGQKPGQVPPGQGPRQGPGPPGKGPNAGPGSPGQGPRPGQGPPGQGPPGQGQPGQGPRQGQAPAGKGPNAGPGPPGQGPRPGQGPPGQGPNADQGPPGQGPRPGQGPNAGQGPPGQGPKPGQAPPGQGPTASQAPGQGPAGLAPRQGQGQPGQGPQGGQGPKPVGPPQQKGASFPQQGPAKPGPKQQGPPGPGAHPGESARSGGPPGQLGAGKPGGGLCPLCKTTQLNIGSKDTPNYSNCTECKNQVCSLCGFSPPDSAGKEWLCLNCQMQRAMGGMDPPGVTKPKQGSAPPSPQRQASGKPGKLLIKQQSTTDHGLTPPTTPRQKSPGSTSPGPLSPGSSLGGSPKIDPKTGRPIQPKSSPQQSPAKAKQESSFFGGLGSISLGGLTDAKPPASASQASESVTGKLFGGFGGLMESSKPQAQAAPKQEESVAGKLFGGFGGLKETTKTPAAASQMFSFGSSLLSSASNLVSGEEEKAAVPPPESPPRSEPGSPADSGPGSPPDSPFSPLGSPPDSDSAPDTPPAKSRKPRRTLSVEQEEKEPVAKLAPAPTSKVNCPLCNVELNAGSVDPPNYSFCTDCKKTVCNLCGFNPTPHLGEKEWLCLNCQTQRAMMGQLGDMPPAATASPLKQPPSPPAPSTTPAAVDSKPVVEATDLTPPVPDTKVKMAENMREPGEKEISAKDGSPTSPSDLAKLESTVLPILEAKTQPKEDEETLTDTLKTRRKLQVLPLSPDSPSSEDDRGLSEKNAKGTTKKKLLVPVDVRADSFDDSSESFGKESPISGDDEEFIRKQIMEMSENEDASPSDEENLIRRKIRENEKKQMEQKKTEGVERSASGKAGRLTKKCSICPDEEEDKQQQGSSDEPDINIEEGQELKEGSGTGVRKFRIMELTSTSSPMHIPNDDREPEMESLTDSPDDRSRGEGSSSLHASSFTPGTSPTSLSSLDEDSDSSSPSHIRSGEGKQHRKAKHRQPGQTLPTIEDSSEEEELREEEELLREQEKQKGSGKKSKKDKEEIRAQRRRERPKTPPSNLSPIEDASPTEELRQEAEMEEIRRSSCSDFSPSVESDSEGFEIHPAKIAAVQKTYQLPISVSIHSPSDAQNLDQPQKKSLKTADEAYEEIMLRAKSPTLDKGNIQPAKESLYGGMLIEDYAYASLIDNSTVDTGGQEKMNVPAQPKTLRSPDEVYEDMIKKRKEFIQLEKEYQKMQPTKEVRNPEIVLQPAEDTFSNSTTVTLGKDGKPLLDAETAYEELIKRTLTPGTSPTLQDVEATASKRALNPIPDLRVTQCSSGELSSDDESMIKKEEKIITVSDMPEATETEPVTVFTESTPSSTSYQKPHTTITESELEIVDLSSSLPRTSVPVIVSVSPLPTVPQYTPSVPSVVSTTPPLPPKPSVLLRANSQEKAEVPVAPPLPPPTPPKPTVFPRKAAVPLPPQASATHVRPEMVAITAAQGSPTRQAVTPMYKPQVPPPVAPKPSIHAGIGDSHRSGHCVKPPIAPKPGSQPASPAHVAHSPRPTVLPTGLNDIALNLSPSSESKLFQPSPKSPSSPRYTRNLWDTYVVITLPSQPNSPVESLLTQAPSSPGPAFSSCQAQPQSYYQPQPQLQSHPQHTPQPTPPQTTRVPLAFTRVTESIENQEFCGPEKHVSSSCHIIEAISASAQPPVVMPNMISQVVTTEVQRTTVSVVHERTSPPVPAPRANGVPISIEKPKPQLPARNGQGVQPSEVVDLRTMKVDQQSDINGVDLSAGPDSRRQSFAADISRQSSAVHSPVVNLSAESSTVSIVTDSITIVTCAATIEQCDNVDIFQVSSVPLQLTKNKAFEPVSQIIYRPIDSQPSTPSGMETPINLSVGSSTGGGTFQSNPVTIAPTCIAGYVANGLTTGSTTVAGAVDLSTTKPFNTLISVDAASSEAVTAVLTDDDGKPVDLTAGKRAVCCDVVYNLPFAGSCTSQQTTTPLPEDRFGYRDDHYQYDRSPYGMRGFGGIKPSMSDTNLAEAGLFFYKSKNSYDFSGTTEGAVDLTSAKISDAGEAVDYSKKGSYAGMTIPPYSQARVTSAVGTLFGTSSVLRSSNGVVYSSVAAPIPSTYAITTQPGSIFSTTYNTLSGMHTSDTMPSLSDIQNLPLTRSHSFLSTINSTPTLEQEDAPLNLEISRRGSTVATASLSLDYTDASLDAIAASLEALSSPMVPGDGQYQAERERLEMEKLKQQRLAEELEWERQEIQRFREHEQFLVQKELEELQAMKQHILNQQEEERQAHLMMQKETYAQQQQQLEQIQRLQEQLRMQLEEQKLRQMYPGGDLQGHGVQEAVVLGPDGTVLSRKITDSGCQTDEEDEAVSKAYTAGRKKKSAKKSVDSCVQTDDEDQDEWEAPTRNRPSRPRTARGDRGGHSEMSLKAHTEISIQTDTEGNIRVDSRMELSDSERTSPKKVPTPLEIGQSPNLKVDSSTLQAPPKSLNVLYSPISPCISPSKSLEFVSYEKSLGDTSPQKLRGSTDPSKASPVSPRAPKAIQRSMSDPKPMSPTGEERATCGTQYGDSGKGSGGTPTGTQKKVKRTLPNPPSEDESTTSGQTAHNTGSARRRMCRNSNMARAKILQDIDRELDLVERESSKLRKKQAELDEEEKEIDAKLRYLEMGINRRKDVLLIEREKRERAYLQSVAEDRDYMSDSEVSNIRETRGGLGSGEDEEIEGHNLERPRTAPQSELDDFVPPQTKYEYGKYSQNQYYQSQYQQSLYQTPQSYQSHSLYSSVPSLTSSQQQSYHQMLLLQQKAARQAALLSELDATKYDVISRQPDPTSSAYLGVKYDKYGNHLDLRALEVGSMPRSPMTAVSDSYYTDVDPHTPRSYMLLEDAAELAKGSTGLSSSYSLAERELAKAEKLLRRSAADLCSAEYLGSTSRLHTFGKTPDEEDTMEEPYELKLLKQQLKQEFRRSTAGTENIEQLTGLSQHYYTPSSSVSSYSQRQYPKSDKYSISRLTLEKQAAKQLPASMLYQKHKAPLIDPKISSKYSAVTDNRGLETDYTSYLGSTSASARTSRLSQDEITFGLRKNIAEQQKYLGSTLGANLAGSLNLGQSLGLDSAYPSGSRSRPSSRPTSCYGLDLSIKRDPSSSSLRLKGDSELSGDIPSYQTPSGRTKPTSLPIVQSGRGRLPIVAQNSEEESPLSPVGQPMGMARASAGPLPPISADSRDQFGSCLSLQDSQQQQHIREEPTRGRGYVLLDDLQGTMSDSEALSDSQMALNRDDATNAYHLRREETDWFDKPRDGRPENGQDKRQGKGLYYPFPHLRVKLQRDPKDRSVSGNGLGIRVVGGKEVPGSNGDIGAYVAKVLPGGAAEQTGKILEGMQVLEWSGVPLTGKTYEEVQGLVGQPCNEADVCVRLDLNMLAESDGSDHLDFQEHSKGDRPPRSPGVDPKQLAAELQKVSQQQAPSSSSSSGLPPTTSATSSPGQPGSPSVGKKRHSSKTAEGIKTMPHPISGEIQLQINYDKQLGNLIVHVLQARNLAQRDNNGYSDPFVKVYLLPGRGQVMVVQNASAENKRRSKPAGKSLNPEWNQTVIYKNIHLEQLRKKTLEVSVWDYDKCSSNDFLGEVLIDLSNTAQLDNVPRWLLLKEQSEGDHHRRSHSGQSRHGSSKPSSQHSSPKTGGAAHDNQDSPKSSVIKSRSHGIFPDPAKARSSYRSGDAPVTAASLDSGLSGSAYSLLDEEGEMNEVDSAIFQVPRLGKIPNGTDEMKSSLVPGEMEGKSQVMGEIKIALKKEIKTEGEQLVLEILQCRNITYKFKTADHLPDLYVKLYVVNIATQKRIIKKKTRVCRHDREPSFNETFRFCMNPAGHSLQLFLVSNGGKFVKKTLIGEAYVWLDKVDLRKRVVSWHKLLASTAQIHS
ncbi:protein piccolo isoform 6-T6 [Spinachia spinachia]